MSSLRCLRLPRSPHSLSRLAKPPHGPRAHRPVISPGGWAAAGTAGSPSDILLPVFAAVSAALVLHTPSAPTPNGVPEFQRQPVVIRRQVRGKDTDVVRNRAGLEEEMGRRTPSASTHPITSATKCAKGRFAVGNAAHATCQGPGTFPWSGVGAFGKCGRIGCNVSLDQAERERDTLEY
jgi:hypothetical protein